MGFLKKIFGGGDNPPANAPLPVEADQTPCTTERELLERYGGMGLEKQFAFGDVIGGNSWNADLQAGTISFGPTLTFNVEVLGTFSHSSETWLWAWANKQLELSDGLLRQALQLKAYGETHGIDLLRNATFGFSVNELHIIGIIASGMFSTGGYYIADYGQGAMLVTIAGGPHQQPTNSHHKVAVVFPQLISQFELDHKRAFKAYLIAKGFTVSESGNTVTGAKDGKTISGEFDELSRLTRLVG